MNDIRKILEASSQPGGRVSSELLPLVYDELRALAAKRLAKDAAADRAGPRGVAKHFRQRGRFVE